MSYRELLERYKKGLVSEEEKQRIEEDLEKYEAIEEHLSENIDMDLTHLAKPKESNQNTDETIKIKKSVNSRLKKVVFTSVAIVMGLLIGIFFVISPLIDSFYYNPSKASVDKVNSDISFDLYALAELNMPGHHLTSDVYIDRQGFGEYDIGYSLRDSFTQQPHHITTKIKRDKKIINYTEAIEGIRPDFHEVRFPDFPSEKNQRVIDHIMQLNPVSYVSLDLTFEKDLTMEELRGLQVKYPNVQFVWAGIRTSTPDEISPHLIGIKLLGSNHIMTRESGIGEKYPAFHILEWLVKPTGYDSREMSLEAKSYELHYKSLVQYVIDRKEAAKILDPGKYDYYKSAFSYTEENGVKTFGVRVYADAKDIIELIENEPIKSLELNGVLASRGYIK